MLARCCLLLLATAALAAPNLYPDPGFEDSGKAGEAHSGQKAGYLPIAAREHWRAMGGEFPVTPYATYHATAWVKAKSAQGSCLALYVYQWDSYVWAFGGNVAVPNGGDWRQVEMTFRSPTDRIFLHPLAWLDAANGEAWVDDIDVRLVASPAETIAALNTKTALSGDEQRLLARYDVEHGERAAALALIGERNEPTVNADIACVLGLSAKDPAERLARLGDMVRYGAPGYNDGAPRLNEVIAGLDVAKALDGLHTALLGPGATPAMRRAYAQGLIALMARPRGPATVGARKALVDRLAAEADALSRAEAGGAPSAEAVRLSKAVAAERERLESEMQQLGKAEIMLGGRPITPATHVIVMPDTPTPSEDTAAHDLQAHLEKITGAVIPFAKAADVGDKACLIVGHSPLVTKLGVQVDFAKLGVEGVRQKTIGPHLVLIGNQRGVLYAVYGFLEEQLGCRWFTPDCATWPKAGRLVVGDLDVTYVPPLEYRATDYPNSRPPEFAVRNHLNGTQIAADEKWGGKVSYRGFVHTFDSLVPPEIYGATHPEYYSQINGKRLVHDSQLCLTNPDVLRVAADSVRRWIKESPEATIISVSQNDRANFCTCDKCRALAQEEGAQSGPLLHFVNGVADAIAKESPNIIIDTLAYQWSRKPPLHVKPHANVAIRLCSIECEFNRPIETSPYNHTFVNDIHGWNQICSRLHIWDYVINYAHCIQPFPNLKVIGPNIRFFVNNGVTGVYEEADYFTKGGELAELRTYLMAKLLWRPDYDAEKAIDEFMAAYYGPAAPMVRAYIDDTHRLAVSDPNFHMPIYIPPRSPFQTPEAIDRYRRLFDLAQAAVKDDPVRLHRVEVARLPIIYTQLAQRSTPTYRLTATELVPAEGGSITDLAKEFARIAHAEGLTQVAEGGGELEAFLARLPRSATQPVVRLAGGGLKAVVAPALGGRLLSLTTDAGLELLQMSGTPNALDAMVGGYVEYSRNGYQSPGWAEPYTVSQQSADAVTVTCQLRGGLTLSRRYELDAQRKLVRIQSKLTNDAKTAQLAGLRAHPCLHLDNVDKARLVAEPHSVAMSSSPAAASELWLRATDCPKGEWAVADAVGGLTVTQRFKPAQVDTAYLNWNYADRRVNLELFTAERTLQPGESQSLEQELEWK